MREGQTGRQEETEPVSVSNTGQEAAGLRNIFKDLRHDRPRAIV